MEEESFAVLLQRYRQAAEVTQEELAEQAGLSARGISDLERGLRTRPRRDTVRRLAAALGLPQREKQRLIAAARRGPATQEEPGTASARSHAVASTRLPQPATPFIGRAEEVEGVCSLLAQPEVRLLTLTGPAGVGKTRLALRVAELQSSHVPVTFVSLADLTDPGLVSAVLLDALGLTEEGRTPALHILAAALQQPHLLLIDNLEHLPVASLLSRLLDACPRLSILATSREPLHLAREHQYLVPPLPVPAGDADLDTLLRSDAVSLFIARARASGAVLNLDVETASIIADICRRVDGLPLAVELAAARSRLLPPPLVLEHLDRPFELLIGGARDLPPRQRTLHDTLTWSYDLLLPGEQALFRRLAVFRGSFDLPAARAVGGVEGVALVFSLADKSLVQAENGRFRLLAMVREFALEQLREGDEETDARDRHLYHYLAISERAYREMVGLAQAQWMRLLRREHDNLRAALEWAFAAGRLEEGLRLVGALRRFWMRGGYAAEGLTWAERAVARAEGAPAPFRMEVLKTAAAMAGLQGDTGAAVLYAGSGLALAEELGDRESVSHALNILGDAYLALGDLEESASCYRRDIGQSPNPYVPLLNLGTIAYLQERYDEAYAVLQESIVLTRDKGDEALRSYIHVALGRVLTELGEIEEAVRQIEEGRRTAQEVAYMEVVVQATAALAVVRDRQGDAPGALALVAEGIDLCRELGIPAITLEVLDHVVMLRARDQPELAAVLHGASEAAASQRGFAHLTVPPYRVAITEVRKQIGEECFDACQRRGRSLSLRDALSLAHDACCAI